ncbi:site-2 protease family protein [archaeon]|jgi:Zn-dependent protease|nr:site-2 protease family protein [archaeon]MBT4352060.1 site-2 protease family protein [archaeon]MBT4647171.1 site-2 protease family protein [archaeon]MBT6822174.1 site-2 protease family protein [archaeon]MBT7391751.1 site-2 protease family protein [archaeon]
MINVNKRRHWFKFSKEEIKHLLMSWFGISLAYTILTMRGKGLEGFSFTLGLIFGFTVSAMTVGIGFLLHEIAHKYMAQKYGCWAEFRADKSMLLMAIAMAAFAGFLFIAPGAVYIHGHVTTEKNGKISLAGPATNLIIALVFLVIGIIMPSQIIKYIASSGFQINSWLALFNMIPFGNFDGIKILRWNKNIYLATVAIGILFTFVV